MSASVEEVDIVLLLRAVSFQGRPIERELAAKFGEAGGTIGRGENSTLVLPFSGNLTPQIVIPQTPTSTP